jgi:NitT/TauT family transport system permease protein
VSDQASIALPDLAAAPVSGRAKSDRFGFRKPVSRAVAFAAALVGAAGLILVWSLAVPLGWISAVFLPSPLVVVETLWTMTVSGDLLGNAMISIGRVWAAFLLSAVMAIPLGILMSSYRLVGATLEPVIDFIRYLPVPALVPLAIIWFGIGEETKIFLLWLGTFFQLVLLIAEDMKRVPHEYFETAYTLGASPRQALLTVAARAMMPSMVDNLRITLGWCWIYVIIAEIVASDNGLGFVIWAARRYMETAQVMAGVVTIGLIGLLTDQAIRLLHRVAFRYL